MYGQAALYNMFNVNSYTVENRACLGIIRLFEKTNADSITITIHSLRMNGCAPGAKCSLVQWFWIRSDVVQRHWPFFLVKNLYQGLIGYFFPISTQVQDQPSKRARWSWGFFIRGQGLKWEEGDARAGSPGYRSRRRNIACHWNNVMEPLLFPNLQIGRFIEVPCLKLVVQKWWTDSHI